MPSETEVNAAGYPEFMNQESMMYSGLVYSRIVRQGTPSLETDKLDLTDIITQIQEELARKGLNLRTHGVYVNLQVRDMATFAQLNKLYVESFGLRPPVRVCVQPISSDTGRVCMGAYYATDAQLVGR